MTGLKASGVTKRFGGVAALTDVSLDVVPGQVRGLIGPNGCGKTTLLNLLSGYYPIDTGRVMLDDTELTDMAVEKRASLGIARTFQTPRALGSLTVLENVMLGAWQHGRTSLLDCALTLGRSRREERDCEEQAARLLAGVGLGHAMKRRADSLEHGGLRFLEVARALMTQPRFVLLDEPAGGLTHVEIDRLGAVIAVMRREGLGVLLVEHHTDFVFGLCDEVTALNGGCHLVSGPPAVVRHNEELARVYLGE